MGQEVVGTVTVGGQKVAVKGDFGSDRVRFSGGRRGDVPYNQVQVVSTTKGILKLRVDGTAMEFPVGPTVDRLANKIRKPATRLEKMGVKPGLTVALIGKQTKDFIAEVRAIVPDALETMPREPIDILIVATKDLDGLADIQRFAAAIKRDGALWVVYPKNKRDIPENVVLDTCRAAGLKDVKVARFSETWTALKLVVPLVER